jgi:hypothetical protein
LQPFNLLYWVVACFSMSAFTCSVIDPDLVGSETFYGLSGSETRSDLLSSKNLYSLGNLYFKVVNFIVDCQTGEHHCIMFFNFFSWLGSDRELNPECFKNRTRKKSFRIQCHACFCNFCHIKPPGYFKYSLVHIFILFCMVDHYQLLYLCIETVSVWDLTHSLTASGLAAALLILDIGMLVLNRYILLGTAFKSLPVTVAKTLFENFWPDL